MPKPIEITKFFVDTRKLIDRRDWVKYLVLVNWHTKEHEELLQKPHDAEFEKFVIAQLNNYLAGKQAPAAISTAIMNLADENFTSGTVTLRAGDYIALQQQYRAAK